MKSILFLQITVPSMLKLSHFDTPIEKNKFAVEHFVVYSIIYSLVERKFPETFSQLQNYHTARPRNLAFCSGI